MRAERAEVQRDVEVGAPAIGTSGPSSRSILQRVGKGARLEQPAVSKSTPCIRRPLHARTHRRRPAWRIDS